MQHFIKSHCSGARISGSVTLVRSLDPRARRTDVGTTVFVAADESFFILWRGTYRTTEADEESGAKSAFPDVFFLQPWPEP